MGKIVLSAVQVSKGYLEPGKELKYFSSYSSSVHLHLSSSVRSLQQVDLALFIIILMGSHRVPPGSGIWWFDSRFMPSSSYARHGQNHRDHHKPGQKG